MSRKKITQLQNSLQEPHVVYVRQHEDAAKRGELHRLPEHDQNSAVDLDQGHETHWPDTVNDIFPPVPETLTEISSISPHNKMITYKDLPSIAMEEIGLAITTFDAIGNSAEQQLLKEENFRNNLSDIHNNLSFINTAHEVLLYDDYANYPNNVLYKMLSDMKQAAKDLKTASIKIEKFVPPDLDLMEKKDGIPLIMQCILNATDHLNDFSRQTNRSLHSR